MQAFECLLSSIFTTAIRPEHRLRPHSDERPSLPRWDVPSCQAPASHHAPVAVASHFGAHRPQGPGQGGLLQQIRASFSSRSHTQLYAWIHLHSAVRFHFNCETSLLRFWTCLNSKTNIIRFFFLLFWTFQLLKSPGKDCSRFRSLMTETFESAPYQRFLKAHQVR